MSRNSYSPAYFSLVPDRLNEKTRNTNSACTSKGRGIPASQKRHTAAHIMRTNPRPQDMLKRPFLIYLYVDLVLKEYSIWIPSRSTCLYM